MKTIFYIIAVTALLVSCNQSTKGNWTEEDKGKIRANLEVMETSLEARGIDFEEFLDCIVDKSEQIYSSFEEADADFDGCEDMVVECTEELSSSVKSTAGNWSEQDIKKMEYAMNAMRKEIGEDNPNLEAFVACYSSKIIAEYDSFDAIEADLEGCTLLSQECASELGIEY